MTEDLPPHYELSFYLGEIVRNDTWAENEMKNLWRRLADSGLGEGTSERVFARLTKDVRRMLNAEPVLAAFRALALPSGGSNSPSTPGPARIRPQDPHPATVEPRAATPCDWQQASDPHVGPREVRGTTAEGDVATARGLDHRAPLAR